VDSLDLRLLNALHLDGRAPFSRIAEVLGVSDQTVARRYQRLRQEGALRVVGRLDARRMGHVEWAIRLQCAPGTSKAVAAALAKRGDASWVRLASAGTEVVCLVRTSSDEERDVLLLDRLPATRPVVSIKAHCLLRTFWGGQTGWSAVTSGLSEDEVAALSPEPAPPAAAHDLRRSAITAITLDAGDRVLLVELAGDGRMSNAKLAAATGWHEATVRRRIEALRETGALYFDLDIDSRALGYACTAMLWITVEPSSLSAAGQALARHPEITFAAATTGPTNLLGTVVCTDVYALYDYVAEQAGRLPGVREIESAPIIRTVKRTGMRAPAPRPRPARSSGARPATATPPA
jgi:DNA-binding Lrp family transcriptional regulator